MAITVSEKEGVVIFRLSGRIITPGVKEVSETVEEALAVHSSPPRLVFDFKEVTGMDSFRAWRTYENLFRYSSARGKNCSD